MSRRHGRGGGGHEEGGVEDAELNLVPYLDIMVNLIMFMLVTYQVAVELKLIQFNPPASGSDVSQGSNDQEKTVALNVIITHDNFQILTTGGDGKKIIPKRGSDYDYKALTAELTALKTNPELKVSESLMVVAEGDVVYDIVVQTLDATRATIDGKDLFPNVSLGMAVGTK